MNYLGSNIKLLREREGLKQSEMQHHTGISNKNWSNYENAYTEPPIDAMVKISNFFRIDLETLIKEDLRNAHLIPKILESKKQENAHLNAHPIAHPNNKKKAKIDHLTSIENTLQEVLNDNDMEYQSNEFNQEQMAELSNRMGKIEEFISKLTKEIEDQRKRKRKRGP